jgi:amidase
VRRACAESGEPIIHSMLPTSDESETFNYSFGRLPTVADRLLVHTPVDVPMERHVLYPENSTEEAIAQLKRHYPQPPEDDAPVEYDSEERRGGAQHEDGNEQTTLEPGPPGAIADVPPQSAYELWRLHAERRLLQKAYLDHWNATVNRTGTGRPVDAIISPVAAYPAPPHGYNS